MRFRGVVIGLGLVFAAAAGVAQEVVEWPAYGLDAGGTRYARIDAIHRDNVAKLERAWVYRTGDVALSPIFEKKAAFESTPLMVNGTLYLTTPACRVIALDAETGNERWSYDPKLDLNANYSEVTNRGVALWDGGGTEEPRIFLGTLDARLVALDASTGEPAPEFGDGGTVDLSDGISLQSEGQYQVTSPPAIVNDIVVIGSSMGDNRSARLEEGVVRAFDARTGEQRWSWDPIPRSDDAPFAETWRGRNVRETGAANVWSLISADAERDLVFLPTTSPSPDHFGGERLGDNVYANCVVAVRASTGEVVWHFQVVHHDVWDYDVPCQPVLSTVQVDDKELPVVIQGTKMGHVFVLHRETGKPVFSVEERTVPSSDVEGEETSTTQPFPVKPPPLIDDLERPLQAWGPDAEWFHEEMKKLRYDGRFTPPSLEGSIQFPSTSGGINWGGVSYNPERNILVTNMNRIALRVRLIPRRQFFQEQRDDTMRGETAPQSGTAYGMERALFRLPSGLPASPPPWGVLVAVDMKEGSIMWRRPLGHIPSLEDQAGGKEWGSPMLGGAITTAGGLVFVAATMDGTFRAIDIDTGEELWSDELPAGGQATPMTYRATEGGKQYVVICAGGHGKMGTKQGDYVIAYALP